MCERPAETLSTGGAIVIDEAADPANFSLEELCRRDHYKACGLDQHGPEALWANPVEQTRWAIAAHELYEQDPHVAVSPYNTEWVATVEGCKTNPEDLCVPMTYPFLPLKIAYGKLYEASSDVDYQRIMRAHWTSVEALVPPSVRDILPPVERAAIMAPLVKFATPGAPRPVAASLIEQ